jgi:hypothetical protein
MNNYYWCKFKLHKFGENVPLKLPRAHGSANLAKINFPTISVVFRDQNLRAVHRFAQNRRLGKRQQANYPDKYSHFYSRFAAVRGNATLYFLYCNTALQSRPNVNGGRTKTHQNVLPS